MRRAAQGLCARSQLLEVSIALYALALPWGVHLGTPLIDAAARHLSPPQWHALMTLAALLLLTLPAAAMGAGFPLLLEGWKRHGRDIGTAYGSNTLGAAAGALLPLLLLPSVGWSHADTRGRAAEPDRRRGPFHAGPPGAGRCAVRKPGGRTQALGDAAR